MRTLVLLTAALLLAPSCQVWGKSMKVELLAKPCKAKQILGGNIVTDRRDGRERFVLANCNEESNLELIYLDFEKNCAEVFEAPVGKGAWSIIEVPNDRLVISSDKDFVVFDLKDRKFTKTAAFTGEMLIWTLVIGGDGRVYGGTYPGGKLGAFDLKTYQMEDLGAPAPPNQYLRFISALPDGRLLCNFITNKPMSLLYDPSAKKFSEAPKALDGKIGLSWHGYFLTGSSAFNGSNLDQVSPYPFPAPDDCDEAWSVEPSMTRQDTLVYRCGNRFYNYRFGESKVNLLADVETRNAYPLVLSKEGWVIGIRGSDYFVIKPGDTTLTFKPIPVEGNARSILFLKQDPAGVIWGGPFVGQTLFSFDPGTGKANNTGVICDSGGEVYDVAFYGGKVYAASYSLGNIVRYDPERPWDQWNNKNPKTITTLFDRGYIRPIGGIKVGPYGKLYAGWMARYGSYNGAISITDPYTGDTELIENPFGEQGIYGLDLDGTTAYVGTTIMGTGLPPKTDEHCKFGILDLDSRKVIFSQDMPGKDVLAIRAVRYDPKTHRVAMISGESLRVFDTETKLFLNEPPEFPQADSFGIAPDKEGHVFYGSGNRLLKLDLASMKLEKVAEMPAKITNVMVGANGTVYVSCGSSVYAAKVN